MTAAAAFPARANAQRHPALAEMPTVIPDLIAELSGEAGGGPIRREDALDLLRRHLGRIQSTVQDGFEAHELSGLAAARWLAALSDGLMTAIHHYALAMVPPRGAAEAAEPPFALVATGGYGRGVLAPYSDIDLLFLTDQSAGPRSQRVVEFVLYLLWDLGLKVGHATRSIRDCMDESAKDATILTALVDARFLAGEKPVFERFLEVFNRTRQQRGLGSFLAAKRAERAGAACPLRRQPLPRRAEHQGRPRRAARPADALLAGALRLRHPAHARPGRAGQPRRRPAVRARGARHPRSWDFLWTVRFHLHYVAGRAEERLTFDFQPVVGARMGYTPRGRQDGVERFMKHLFLTVRDVLRLTRVLEPAIERAALGPPATRRHGRCGAGGSRPGLRRRQAGGGAAEPRLLPRADPDAADPQGGAGPQAGNPPAGHPGTDPQRPPRRQPARDGGGQHPLPRHPHRPRRRRTGCG